MSSYSNDLPEIDSVLIQITDYVCEPLHVTQFSKETAKLCLMDALGCAILSLNFSDCTKLLGHWFPNDHCEAGVLVPGGCMPLEPLKAAWDFGVMIRWLDFNDTWLAAEWGHPSDNIGALWVSSLYASIYQKQPICLSDFLDYIIKAYEIQGMLALENSFNRVGLDHVLLVKIASAALSCRILGGNREQVLATLSQAWVDGQSLRTYRHAPNAGSRKSWAAGDAGARAIQLALLSLKGEPGYKSALSAPQWGFEDVLFNSQKVRLEQNLSSYVIDNILFKIAYPAEFHAQTAVECAISLHHEVAYRIEEIDSIQIQTQESAMRIIVKEGPLHNPADRDHCLQYMVAVGLLYGRLSADDYSNQAAEDQRIDYIRGLIRVSECQSFTKDYMDPSKRSIANSVQVLFKDGSKTEHRLSEYPIGHVRRRQEGLPLLLEKFKTNLGTQFTSEKVSTIIDFFNAEDFLCKDIKDLSNLFCV